MNKLGMIAADEYKKLLLQRKTKIMLALFLLFPVGVGLVTHYLNGRTGVQIVAPERFPVFVLDFLTGLVLPVLAIFLASELIAGEFKDGTMKNLFALPVAKSIIYLGKILAGAAITGTCLAATGLAGLAMGSVLYGTAVFGGIGGMLAGYLGTFLVLVMLLTLAGLVALLTGSSSMAILLNLVVWFGLGVVGTFVTGVGKFLPTSLTGWYQPLISGVNISSALPPLLYMISYCVLFAAAGLMLFEKKEV